jgi:arylsulfatase A
VYNAIPFLSPTHLRQSEITIASLLKKAGYATAQVGKWHLNGMFNLPGQPQPNDHGFDHWFAVQNNALPNHHNPYNFVRNGIPQGPIAGYSAGIVANEAVNWLTTIRDKSKPFFLYVAFNEPHEPIATDPRSPRACRQYRHLVHLGQWPRADEMAQRRIVRRSP